MKKSRKSIVKIKEIQISDKKEDKEYKKAKRKKSTLCKNVAIFLSAFCVLYMFFVLTFGDIANGKSETTFYALSSGSFETLAQAYDEADKIKLLGGSGNIWENGSKYEVLAFVYNDADSAREVQNRLNNEGLVLTIVKLEIDISGLEEEEKAYATSLIDISGRVYDITLGMPSQTSGTQTTMLLDEIKKAAITASVKGEILASTGNAIENIAITGMLVSDAFTTVSAAQTITTQELSWLRAQILIYAYDFTQNY